MLCARTYIYVGPWLCASKAEGMEPGGRSGEKGDGEIQSHRFYLNNTDGPNIRLHASQSDTEYKHHL